jgi:general L-amino acid transport system permease protein
MHRPFADARRRVLLYQSLVGGIVVAVVWLLAAQIGSELRARGIRSGFSFLLEPAGFSIGESLLDFDAGQPYWRAFLVGVLNTLRVAMAAIVLATLLGLTLGACSLSRNLLLRGLCRAYLEVFRNIPLLLQLLTWYFLLAEKLPPAAAALNPLPGVFLSKSGLAFPWAGDVPAMGDFGIDGGAAVTPEFLALLFGLSGYGAAYLAEIVRAGIRSVPRGQVDAAAALGMTPGQRLRWVVLPQALRLIIPPATNQFLNLTKNSSLAVVVGYPDLVSIANTSLNQTGQAAECISILMAVYLALSLITAAATGGYNQRLLRRDR